jgi:hypothetical protein
MRHCPQRTDVLRAGYIPYRRTSLQKIDNIDASKVQKSVKIHRKNAKFLLNLQRKMNK